MDKSYSRSELVKIFVRDWHLNVSQIYSLGDSGFDSRELIAAISELLKAECKYPSNFDTKAGFEGSLAEVNDQQQIRVTKMSEYSTGKFAIVNEELHDSVETAAEMVVKNNWGSNFDGIKIQW